jgi:glycosyltransferase involved in cell wall biosynthesis
MNTPPTTPARPWPDRPVPIALVITDLDVGGAERALTMLVTRLDRRRWQPSVFCLAEQGALAHEILAAGIPCECLAINRRRPVQAVTRLARRLRMARPRLIQSFLFHANVAARLAALWAGRPYAISGIRVAEHQNRWHLVVDRLTSPLATGSVCVSQGVMRFSRDVGRLDPDRLTVIPNGIDLAPFDAALPLARAELTVPPDAHLALYVGRLDRQKGLPDLLAAAQTVIGSHPGWHLAIAGDGPERDWLTHQLETTPSLRSHVHWLGRRDDIPSLLKTADLLVLPSLWEGMPNVVLEAMAAGRPVVGTAVEGTEDLVIPGETGWLVPAGCPTELAHALVEAARSPNICRRYGIAGRHRVDHHFSIDATVIAYECLWARLLGLALPEREPTRPGIPP